MARYVITGNADDVSMEGKMEFRNGIAELVPLYDVFILDIWGVLHNGVQPYAPVMACLEALQKSGKKIVLLSNMPRRGQTALESLHKMGLTMIQLDQILTSGDALIAEMAAPKDAFFSTLKDPLNFYQIGHTRNGEFLAHFGLDSPQPMENAEYILLSLFTDADEDVSMHLKELEDAVGLGLPLVCANPDKRAPHGDTHRFCAGHYAAYYEAQGGTAIYYGKPHTPIYEVLFNRLKEEGFRDKGRFLMVGDTPETDVLGATRAGIDAALVLSGALAGEPEEVKQDLKAIAAICQKRAGCVPRWVLPGFQWA